MEPTELPKIKFENLKLKIIVGQWLGIIPTKRNFHITKKLFQRNSIQKQFGKVLKLAGIDDNETCLLTDFRTSDRTMICNFQNSGKKANIEFAVYYFNGIPYSTFSVKTQAEIKSFNYTEETENESMKLSLHSHTLKHQKNGNIYEGKFYSSHILVQIKNKENRFYLRVNRPKNIETDTFKLANEEELIKYLLDLTFPIDISEIYRQIKAISNISTDNYPCFTLSIEKSNQTISEIAVNANIDQFTMKRGNTTITIFQNNWYYHSDHIEASQDPKNIHYSVDTPLDKSIAPNQSLHEIHEAVEQAKQLMKTL